MDGWAVMGIPDQNILEEVDQIDIVVHFAIVLFLEQIPIRRCNLHEEMRPVVIMEKKVPHHNLIEQAAEGPDIRSPCSPYLLPAIEAL